MKRKIIYTLTALLIIATLCMSLLGCKKAEYTIYQAANIDKKDIYAIEVYMQDDASDSSSNKMKRITKDDHEFASIVKILDEFKFKEEKQKTLVSTLNKIRLYTSEKDDYVEYTYNSGFTANGNVEKVKEKAVSEGEGALNLIKKIFYAIK